jgi:DNA-binding transcriptional ArsR family regulator
VDVVGAIADPVRRDILAMLRHGPRTAGGVAAAFEISRPAVSRHLRILRETGLVVDQPRGRERHYRLDVAPLAELDAWLAPFRHGWSATLDALETEVYRTRRERQALSTTGRAAAEMVDQSEHADAPVPNEERTA